MDFQIQNYRAPAPRLSPDFGVSDIPNASSVLPDSLVAQGITTFPESPQFPSFGGQDGGDQDPNQNTGDGDAPFSILIDGAGADTSGGTIIPSSRFTIGCNSGDFTITRAGIDAGGTSPQTLGPEELELNTDFSGDFTIGDGFKEFIVFGVVVFSKNSAGRPNAIVISNASGTYNTRIYVRDAGDTTPKFVEGFSDLDEDNPLYMFRIGTVRSTKSGSLRRVYVTQSIVGDYEIGDNLPDTSYKFPLQAVKFGSDKIRFQWGTVHGIVPVVNGVAITTDINDSASPELTIAGTGVIYCGVDLSDDFYEPENPELAFAIGPADPSTIPPDVNYESAYVMIAVVDYDNGSITGIAHGNTGSLDCASCGGVSNYWDLGGGQGGPS